MNLLTDLPGVAVGHATDAALGSGVTAVLFAPGAVGSVVVAGGAPGGRDLGMLAPAATLSGIDAIVLSGGSVYGLDAAGGVQAALRARGRGVLVRGIPVPLVAQAILFDLANGGDKAWGLFSPYRDLGLRAALAAGPGHFELGSVGAGTGATTATVKGGIGSASAITTDGHLVAALMAVNALGTPTVGDGPHFWAGFCEQGDEFGGLGWPARITPDDLAPRLKGSPGTATTIGVVVTDAALTKAQAHRLAVMAHDGLARAILPAHAPMDGDTVFAVGMGHRNLADPVVELTRLGHVATLVTARAVARGVHAATTLKAPGAQPAWRDRFAKDDVDETRPMTPDRGAM